jgi:hypothetical protein
MYCDRSFHIVPISQRQTRRYRYTYTPKLGDVHIPDSCKCSQTVCVLLDWRTMRATSISVGNLDQLPYVRNDVKALLSTSLLRVSPTLVAMGSLGWLITVATIFPPRAMTITSKMFDQVSNRTVPSFDSMYHGNGTLAAAAENMLSSRGDVYT